MIGPRYKWTMLSLSFLLMLLIGIIDFSVPYLLNPIMVDLSLTYSQSGLVFGSLFLGFIFFGPPAGAMIDRFGVRKILVLSIAGEAVASLLRGFSIGFLDLFVYSLIVSICTVIQTTAIGRSISEWFEPSELGFANGIWNVGFCMGALIASAATVTLLLPAMNGWRGVFLFIGSLCSVATVLCILLARDKRTTTYASDHSGFKLGVRNGLKKIARSKDIWLLFATFALVTGSENATISWVPQILGAHGISSGFIEVVGVSIWVGAILGNVVFPALSDKIGLSKPVMLGSIPVFAISMYAILLSPTLVTPIIAGFMLGLTSSYFFPMIITIASQLPEVSGKLVASASGFMITANGLGAFVFPPVGGYLRDLTGSFTDGFAFYIVSALISIPAIAFIRETKRRTREKVV